MLRVWPALALLVAGCASQSSTVKAALYGDLPTLRSEIAKSRKEGKLDRDGVVELSLALAQREVASAQGLAGARRIRSLRACATPLRGSLEERAEQSDDPAAEAMLILLETRALDRAGLVQRYASSSSGAFRAIAARAALERRDALQRRRFFEDPDERVRRAALSAAIEAPDPGDLPALLEAARLDPDPHSQSLAARAAGAVGGEKATLGLRDLWARSDATLRMAIVEGWASGASYRAGGERELVWAAETQSGLEAVTAAAALADSESQSRSAAVTLLARTIAEGSADEQMLAIRVAPTSESAIVKAIVDVSKDAPSGVKAVAFERLAGLPEHKKAAMDGLRTIAKGTDESAAEARASLARLGDASVAPKLAEELKAKDASDRRRAASSLVALGSYAQAADVLADEDPDVRLGLACSILSAKR